MVKSILKIAALILLSSTWAFAQHKVTLSCTPSTSSNVIGYNFYRSSQPEIYIKLTPTPVPTCSYVDTAVNPGAKYAYLVTAINSVGAESPSFTLPVTVTIPIAAPTGVKAVAQ
jgi:hypothetical protein